MILKRRQPKPAGVGDICNITTRMLDKMMATEEYQDRSVSYIREIDGGEIYKSHLRKNRERNNEVMAADQTLLYVADKTPFNGVVKVIPLVIRRDCPSGVAIRSLIEKGRSFLMRLDSLVVSDTATIHDAKTTYSDTALNYIEMVLRNENHYNKSKFSWDGK
tara:strand:+ start:40485 stop:40970 length:486 start_codon:yes stop_codon:yes gene_type:complete